MEEAKLILLRANIEAQLEEIQSYETGKKKY